MDPIMGCSRRRRSTDRDDVIDGGFERRHHLRLEEHLKERRPIRIRSRLEIIQQVHLFLSDGREESGRLTGRVEADKPLSAFQMSELEC